MAGLNPQLLANQLSPAYALATACVEYGKEVQLRPGLSLPKLRQAISKAGVQLPTTGDCLALAAVKAVSEAALKQMEHWSELTSEKALKASIDQALKDPGNYKNEKGRKGYNDGRADDRSYSAKRGRSEEPRSRAARPEVKAWARDIQNAMSSREAISYKYLQAGRRCSANKRCVMLPCNGQSDQSFRRAEQQTPRRGG